MSGKRAARAGCWLLGVALAAEEMAARGETVSARDLVPVYLRLSQAERERLAKGLKITLD